MKVQVYSLNCNEAIAEAFRLLNRFPRHLLHCDWLLGADPVWKGLHDYEEASYGRSLRDTPHVNYPWGRLNRNVDDLPTTVLQVEVPPEVVVHELGHVLHYHIQFERGCVPCTWYAATNYWESFAEAFTGWAVPGYAEIHPDDHAFFESLCRRA